MPKRRIEAKIEPIQKKWLSSQEAQKYLGCSDKFLATLKKNGYVKVARFGNKMYWYELASIDRFLAKSTIIDCIIK